MNTDDLTLFQLQSQSPAREAISKFLANDALPDYIVAMPQTGKTKKELVSMGFADLSPAPILISHRLLLKDAPRIENEAEGDLFNLFNPFHDSSGKFSSGKGGSAARSKKKAAKRVKKQARQISKGAKGKLERRGLFRRRPRPSTQPVTKGELAELFEQNSKFFKEIGNDQLADLFDKNSQFIRAKKKKGFGRIAGQLIGLAIKGPVTTIRVN